MGQIQLCERTARARALLLTHAQGAEHLVLAVGKIDHCQGAADRGLILRLTRGKPPQADILPNRKRKRGHTDAARHRPIAWPSSRRLMEAIGAPSKLTEPERGLSTPASSLKSVDFPAPFGPTTAVKDPGSKEAVRPRRTPVSGRYPKLKLAAASAT